MGPQHQGTPPEKRTVFFQALPKLPLPLNPPSPQFGQVVQLFKNDIFAGITETIKVDYDNDKSDNCDYNFGTFDDFVVVVIDTTGTFETET